MACARQVDEGGASNLSTEGRRLTGSVGLWLSAANHAEAAGNPAYRESGLCLIGEYRARKMTRELRRTPCGVSRLTSFCGQAKRRSKSSACIASTASSPNSLQRLRRRRDFLAGSSKFMPCTLSKCMHSTHVRKGHSTFVVACNCSACLALRLWLCVLHPGQAPTNPRTLSTERKSCCMPISQTSAHFL